MRKRYAQCGGDGSGSEEDRSSSGKEHDMKDER